MNKIIQNHLIEEIFKERKRQILKHGLNADRHSPERWLVILAEEFGEVSHAVLVKDLDNYYDELIQVAAVAMAALEDICDEIIRSKE